MFTGIRGRGLRPRLIPDQLPLIRPIAAVAELLHPRSGAEPRDRCRRMRPWSSVRPQDPPRPLWITVMYWIKTCSHYPSRRRRNPAKAMLGDAPGPRILGDPRIDFQELGDPGSLL